MTLTISAASARRFLVRRHLLAPPRRMAARRESVLACVDRLGSLQFDPLEAPGARNHDLVLHARIRGYRRGWCETWLYGPDRRLIEIVNKALNILPMAELPHHRFAWERARVRWRSFLDDHAADVRRILDEIGARGPLPTGFASRSVSGKVEWWGWGNTSRGRALVEGLFYCGHIGIARREGNARYYDLIERLVPPDILAAPYDPRAAGRHRLLSRVRGLGLLGAGGGEVVGGTGSIAERRLALAELVAEGTLLPAAVEGVRGPRYLLAEEEPLLRRRAGASEPAVTLLAPLDPLVWDRQLVEALWGFAYRWEVYTPAVKRRYGYYVLPVLYGDALVARIEPTLDRERGRLVVAGFWPEKGFRPDAGFARALEAALEALRVLAGAGEVTWRARRRWPRG